MKLQYNSLKALASGLLLSSCALEKSSSNLRMLVQRVDETPSQEITLDCVTGRYETRGFGTNPYSYFQSEQDSVTVHYFPKKGFMWSAYPSTLDEQSERKDFEAAFLKQHKENMNYLKEQNK